MTFFKHLKIKDNKQNPTKDYVYYLYAWKNGAVQNPGADQDSQNDQQQLDQDRDSKASPNPAPKPNQQSMGA